jgi:hypothetical protein
MRAFPQSSIQLPPVANYLADREGLEGTSRAVFLELLYDTFGFRAETSQRAPTVLGVLAIGVAACGFGIEWQRGASLSAVCPWLGIAAIGATFAVLIARGDRRATALNHEHEWRAYCLVIRPMILRSRPGLLNRNLAADQSAQHRMGIGYSSTMGVTFRERGSAFWIAAGAGWAITATFVLVCRMAVGWTEWLLLLPLAGAVFGPLAWSLFRFAVFRRLQRTAESER